MEQVIRIRHAEFGESLKIGEEYVIAGEGQVMIEVTGIDGKPLLGMLLEPDQADIIAAGLNRSARTARKAKRKAQTS